MIPGFDDSGTSLVLSPFYGIRQWRIEQSFPGGQHQPSVRTLRSVAMSYTWAPGFNTATCPKRTCDCTTKLDPRPWMRPWHDLSECQPRPLHPRAAQSGCDCGFWAYNNSDESWFRDLMPQPIGYPHRPNYFMEGVIEGCGMVTVGTKGFRCELGRVVALVGPAESTLPVPDWIVNPAAIEERALLTYGIEADLRREWAAAGQQIAWYPHREAMLADWPLTDLSQYRKEQAA